MQLHDLLSSDVLLEMAYTQKKAERVITSLEKPINDHLLKLWTSPQSIEVQVWKDNLVNWLAEIAEIVFRPANSRPPQIFYYKLLFFEPFGGGAELPNLLRRLRRLYREGYAIQVNVTSSDLVRRLQAFHRDFSTLCSSKLVREDLILEFLNGH